MEKEMTNRKRKAMETKARLIKAARKAISQKGFENVSVEDITREAGVSTGSFYTYFKRKEDIVEAINQVDFYRLAEITNERPGDLTDRLAFYCHAFLEGVEKCGVEICRQWIRNNVAPFPVDIHGETITKYGFDLRTVTEILKEGVRRGELPADSPVDELALLINAELYGLMLAWCMTNGETKGSHCTKSYCRLMLDQTLSRWLTGRMNA